MNKTESILEQISELHNNIENWPALSREDRNNVETRFHAISKRISPKDGISVQKRFNELANSIKEKSTLKENEPGNKSKESQQQKTLMSLETSFQLMNESLLMADYVKESLKKQDGQVNGIETQCHNATNSIARANRGKKSLLLYTMYDPIAICLIISIICTSALITMLLIKRSMIVDPILMMS